MRYSMRHYSAEKAHCIILFIIHHYTFVNGFDKYITTNQIQSMYLPKGLIKKYDVYECILQFFK